MIVSKDNKNVQFAKKLLLKKNRDSECAYLLEGTKLVREALALKLDVKYLLCTKQIAPQFTGAYCPVYETEEYIINSISDTVNCQGVIAVLGKRDTSVTVPEGRCLILDRVQDAGNVGALLRTALATGYNDVYLIACADVFSGKVIRSASSAHFKLRLHIGDFETVFATCKGQKVCADMTGENVFHAVVNPSHALIIGNEGQGISAEALALCDKIVSVPMQNGLESLNVAVSSSIIMYQLTLAKQ